MPRFDDVRLPSEMPRATCRRPMGEKIGTETLLRRTGSSLRLLGMLAAFGSTAAWSAEAPTVVQPAAPPPAVAAPKPPAPDANPSPEHIAKARRLILATGISRSFQIIIPEFMDQIGNTLTQARPDLVHDMIVVLDQLKPEFEKQSDEMIDLSARIYATLLTEKDSRRSSPSTTAMPARNTSPRNRSTSTS